MIQKKQMGIVLVVVLLSCSLSAAKKKGVTAKAKTSTVKASGGKVKVSNSNARLEGLTIEASSASNLIGTFNASNTTLKVTNNNTNVTLSGATNVAGNTLPVTGGRANQNLEGLNVVLDSSLEFASGTKFNGTINAAGQTVKTDATPRSYEVPSTLRNMNDLEFLGETIVATQWTFEGDATVSGNGNVLDLSESGTILVAPDTQLTLANLVLRGLGQTEGLGKIYLTNETSILNLTNVTIELDDDYTFTRGGIYVVGPTTIVTADYVFTVDDQASMTVDGVTLYYDTLTFDDSNNIQPAIADESEDPVHMISVNNGRIVRAGAAAAEESGGDVTIASNTSLTELSVAAPTSKYLFTADATLDGASFPLIFTKSDDTLLEIDDAVVARVTDIRLEHFAPSLVLYGTDAELIFDDAVQIDLGKHDFLESLWTFRGACTLNGHGRHLDLSGGAIELQGAESSLLISDIVLKGASLDTLFCTDNTQTITFRDVTFMLDDVLTVTKGRFEFDGVCVFEGTGTFSYASAVQSRVNSESIVALQGVTLHYDAPVANRDLFALQDSTARIHLDGATLVTTNTGMRLTNGTLSCDHKNYVETTGLSQSQALCIGNGVSENDLAIKLYPGATLKVLAGRVFYNNVDA